MGCYSKYARCCAVVVDVFSKIMQELLETCIPAVDLYDKVINNAGFKKILSVDEMITIQTLMTDGFSKLNVELVYKMVKFFDFILPQKENLGAHLFIVNEILIGDVMERMILTMRNLAFRDDCDIDESKFHTMFNDFIQLGMIVDSYLGRSNELGFRKIIKHIKTIPMADHQEDEYIKAIKEPKDPTFITFPMTSEESIHLAICLNVFEKSLPTVKLWQQAIKRFNEIQEIICGILDTGQPAIVGSVAEGLNKYGVSDMDIIQFDHTYKVVGCIKEQSKQDLGYVQLIPLPDEGHPGYSKLRILDNGMSQDFVNICTYTDPKDGISYLKNNVKVLLPASVASREYTTHGPACNLGFDSQTLDSFRKHEYMPIPEQRINLNCDVVLCINNKQWPVEASEWTTRRRTSHWPTKELFDHITNTGYLLAGVGSKESKESEIQWRVSFNKAEQLIIESFNETQIHCVLLLKLLKEFLNCKAGKNITSYTMKTVMFWCLEEKSDDFWQSSNLMSCFCFCVSKLKSFVEKRFLPNYFIRTRNQFVAEEFTCVILTDTRKHLEDVLQNPKAFISLLVPSYTEHKNTPIVDLQILSQLEFISTWLKSIIYTVYSTPLGCWGDLLNLYGEYNVQIIYKRCNEALYKLKTVRYTQPLIKKLQNFMGVLQYLLFKEENETGEHRTDSTTRNKYSEYMKLGASGDLTHTTLRMATCYLDDDAKENCLKTIRTVTESDGDLFMQTHNQCVNRTLHSDIEKLRHKKHDDCEISLYNKIIYDIDFIYHDPYKTLEAFESLKKRGIFLIGYDSLSLAWKRSYFDVTFMLAEVPVLPKPAALELCIDNSKKHVSFHPFLYGLLLEFLWYEKNGPGKKEKESILEKMNNCVLKLPDEQKSRGFNFMAYCFSLQKDYRSASRCLIKSFNLNPVTQNVAHLYIKYISKLLLEISFDSDNCILYSRKSEF